VPIQKESIHVRTFLVPRIRRRHRTWREHGRSVETAHPVAAATPADAPQAATAGTTTLDDQVELALTVYNSNLALVRDVRNLQLARGTSDLHFMDIAATVNPATVHFRSLTEPARVSVLEQNYEYDLLEPEKLLKKYVGREVTLVRMRQEGGATREEEVKAHLLSYNTAPVWSINGEIVTGLHADSIKFPELPGNLYSRPTLIWTLANDGGARHRVEAVVPRGPARVERRLRPDRRARRQDGRSRRLGHVAQRQRHVVPERVSSARRRRSPSRARRAWTDAGSGFESRRRSAGRPDVSGSLLDYHLYTLGRKTTINNAETKQVSMLGATGFPVLKRYVVDGQYFYYRNAQHPAPRSRTSCRSSISSRTTRRQASACRCPSATCASIRPTARAACSSSAKITSITRRRTKCSTSRSAMRST
jgi:hypothetical protein